MKMIFLGEAARDSGSLGFSDAWPLMSIVSRSYPRIRIRSRSCTHHPAQTAWTSIRSATSTINSTFA